MFWPRFSIQLIKITFSHNNFSASFLGFRWRENFVTFVVTFYSFKYQLSYLPVFPLGWVVALEFFVLPPRHNDSPRMRAPVLIAALVKTRFWFFLACGKVEEGNLKEKKFLNEFHLNWETKKYNLTREKIPQSKVLCVKQFQ